MPKRKTAIRLPTSEQFVFSTWRGIDPTYPPHLLILALSLITAAIFTFSAWGMATVAQAASVGVGSFLAVFLAWALSRELDPYHQMMAFLAPILTALALIPFTLPSVLYLVWVLLMARILTRSVHPHPTSTDYLLLIGLGWWLISQGASELAPLMFVALFIDSVLPGGKRDGLLSATVSLAGGILVLYFFQLQLVFIPYSLELLAFVVAMGGLFFPAVWKRHETKVLDDKTRQPLNVWRIKTTQAMIFTVGVTALLANGENSILALLPLWAAILGSGVSHLTQPAH